MRAASNQMASTKAGSTPTKTEVSTIEDPDQERGFFDTENTLENNIDKKP
jgi:hypothetical protein